MSIFTGIASKTVLGFLLLLLAGCASGGVVEKLIGVKGQTSVFSSPAADTIGNGQHVVGLLVANEDNSLTDGLSNSFYLSGKLAAENLRHSPITLIIRRHDHTKPSLKKAVSDILEGGAKIIIGPDKRVDIATLSTLTNYNNVPIISFGLASDLKNNIYAAGLSQTEEIKLAADEIKKRGHKSVIIAYTNKPASTSYAEDLTRWINKVDIPTYPLDISDPSTAIETLENSLGSEQISPNAIVFAMGPLQAGNLIASLRSNPKFSQLEMIGHSGWAIGAEHIPHDKKIWFTSLFNNTLSEFSKKFQVLYKQNPSLAGAIAYDLVVMAGVLPQIVPKSPYDEEILTNKQGFKGLTGSFIFDTSGRIRRTYFIQAFQDR